MSDAKIASRQFPSQDDKVFWRGGLNAADMATGLIGAGILLPVELVLLRPTNLDLLATTVAMFAALGWFVGVGVALGNALAARLRPKLFRALARTVASLAIAIPVGANLFDGAKASTLPGATLAPIWFPIVAGGTLAIMVLAAERWVSTRWRRLWFAATLLTGAVLVEWVNRNVQRGGYPDVHTMLLAISCLAAGLGARVLNANLSRPWPQRQRLSVGQARAATALTVGLFVVALLTGLRTPENRWQVATQGLHVRLLVRVCHGLFDFDRDGYANILGGGDCNNLNGKVYPGAREVPGNQVDENCDGLDDNVAAKAFHQARRVHQTEGETWRGSPGVKQQLAPLAKMNVLLLSIDALRADVLDGSAESRQRYPNFWRLLNASQHFTRAFAPSAGTDLSMAGVLTGQIDPFTTKEATMAEAFRQAGRRTYAVVPSEVIRYVGKAILTRGFDKHEELINDLYQRDVGSHSTSTRTTQLGLSFLQEHQDLDKDVPFFMWLHYFDVHEHDELKADDKRVALALGPEKGLSRRERYKRLVKLVDDEVGVLLQELAKHGWTETTVIALVSDHGEGLGEDRRLPENHGRFVYNALTHVPLAIRIPGVAGRQIGHAVSLLDLHPTLLELFSLRAVTVDGGSVLAHVLAGAPDSLTKIVRPLPLNESEQFGVIVWPYKLLVRRKENLEELYDLATDFGETRDLSSQDPDRVASLLATFSALSRVEVDRTKRGRLARERAAKAGAKH